MRDICYICFNESDDLQYTINREDCSLKVCNDCYNKIFNSGYYKLPCKYHVGQKIQLDKELYGTVICIHISVSNTISYSISYFINGEYKVIEVYEMEINSD